MAQVTIQNFAVDMTNLGGAINLENAQLAGVPTLSPSLLSATLVGGRSVSTTGAFQPLVTYLANENLPSLLANIGQIRFDTLSLKNSGTAWIDASGLDLTGPEILAYATSKGITDVDDIGNAEVNGLVALALSGNDTIVSGVGNDTLTGFAGNDIVLGMNGNDLVYGDAGDDDVNGNLGVDTVFGGEGADFVRGGQGLDVVYGGPGDDWHVNGNIGDDTVYGNVGNDTVFGGQGNDTIAGDNIAFEITGNDLLIGNLGNDMLIGDPGNDTMQGDAGADVFLIYTNDGQDRILDFDLASEVIYFEPNINNTGLNTPSTLAAFQSRMTSDGAGGTIMDLGSGNSLRIIGIAPGQFERDNFDFIVF